MSHNVSLLTLVLPVASLYLFMPALLHFSLQDSCPGWLVVVGGFQNVGGIYEVVFPSSHNVIPIDIELEDWDLQSERDKFQMCTNRRCCRAMTYTAVGGRVYAIQRSIWCHGGQTSLFFMR